MAASMARAIVFIDGANLYASLKATRSTSGSISRGSLCSSRIAGVRFIESAHTRHA
jgi:hypothetical protein